MDTVQLAKDAQMDLLIELDRICKKWDIPYFLSGGTLIGAIRHGGYIPWDDDIDVGMLREHYDRFQEACRQDLDPAYMLHNWNDDPYSPHGFFKLKIRGTHYPEGLAANSKMNDSIYIDIFPYDNTPTGKLQRKKQAAENYLLRKILFLRCGFNLGRDSLLRRALYGTLCFASRIRSVKGWKKVMDRLQRRYNHRPSEYMTNFAGSYSNEIETMRREWIETTVPYRFEGVEFSIPAGYDQFLRHAYGDYMQLPPEEKRAGKHEIGTIDLGNYQIRFHCPSGDTL